MLQEYVFAFCKPRAIWSRPLEGIGNVSKMSGSDTIQDEINVKSHNQNSSEFGKKPRISYCPDKSYLHDGVVVRVLLAFAIDSMRIFYDAARS